MSNANTNKPGDDNPDIMKDDELGMDDLDNVSGGVRSFGPEARVDKGFHSEGPEAATDKGRVYGSSPEAATDKGRSY